MNKFVCAAAATVLAAAGSAFAGLTTVQTVPFSGELSPFGPVQLEFAQFNGAESDLMAVQLDFVGTISAQVTAENDNNQPAPEFGIQLTGFLTIDVPTPPNQILSGTANFSVTQSSGGVGPSDGVPGSGPDFHDFGLVSDTASGDDAVFNDLNDPNDLAAFVGNGSVFAEVFAQGGFAVTGASNSTINVINFMVEGEVTITYKFIPTPGAAGLLSFAGLGAVARRRR